MPSTARVRSSNFYPRPPRGGRHLQRGFDNQSVIFLSTPSARRATCIQLLQRGITRISIHALREEGDFFALILLHLLAISIHALREEGDPQPLDSGRHLDISIHALREEGDFCPCISATLVLLFLSTPSARRATSTAGIMCRRPTNFYPRPPRGGRQAAAA